MGNTNLAQVQKEKLPQENFDGAKLYKAVENKKIIHSNLGELKSVLRNVMMKVGLRGDNWPTEIEKGLLIDFILKNYSGHTCEEITLAFEMALTGKLNLDEKEIPCYENFSCMYFAKIMNAYREWAKLEINHKPKIEMNVIEDGKKGLSDDEMEIWVNQWFDFVKYVSSPVLIPDLFYDWLVKRGRISLSGAEKDELLNRATSVRVSNLTEQVKSEGNHGKGKILLEKFNEMNQSGMITGSEVRVLKTIAKKIAVMEYLKNNYDAENK